MALSKEREALQNLYFYAKEVCGLSLLSPKLHGEMCEVITDGLVKERHNVAVLVPRGFFKSSLGLATCTWLAMGKAVMENDYEWRALIDTETMTLSKKHIGWIARVITSRQHVKFFGEVYKRGKGAGNGEIFFNQRATKGGVTREPNFMASSQKLERTGLHFDFHWYDYLLGERNCTTNAFRQHTIEHFYSSLNLLEPGGLVLYTATPWRDGDLSGALMKAQKEAEKKDEKKFFSFYVRYALENEKREPDENFGVSIFPERFPTEDLQGKRKMMERGGKRYLWRAQQMIDPCVPEEAIPFDRQTLYAPRTSFPNHAFLRLKTVTVDPNFRDSDKASGDYAAIVVGGFDHHANWWGIDVRMGRWTSQEFIDQLFDVNKTWRPHLFRMEKKFTSHLMSAIHQQESLRNEAIPMTFVERDWRSKDMRHEMLKAIFGSHRIKFAAEIAESVKDEMEDELSRVGTSTYDDFLDALGDQFTGIYPVISEMDREEEFGLAAVAGEGREALTPEMMGFIHMTEDKEPKDSEEPWW